MHANTRSCNRYVSNWIRRHIADPHVRASVRDEYRSRAAYKLMEINSRFNVIKPNGTVVDLGSAPGSWTQVAVQAARAEAPVPSPSPRTVPAVPLERVNGISVGQSSKRSVLRLAAAEVATRIEAFTESRTSPQTAHATSQRLPISVGRGLPQSSPSQERPASVELKVGRVIAVDLSPMSPVAGSTFIRGDFREAPTREALRRALGSHAIDVVLSDMAHSFVGSGTTDHTLQMQLAWTALMFASENLGLGGHTVIKARYGDEYRLFCLAIKGCFSKVRDSGSLCDPTCALQRWFSFCCQMIEVKPPASRAESAEAYVVGLGYAGSPATGKPLLASAHDSRLVYKCLADHGLRWGVAASGVR